MNYIQITYNYKRNHYNLAVFFIKNKNNTIYINMKDFIQAFNYIIVWKSIQIIARICLKN